jgi:hypothetical protein
MNDAAEVRVSLYECCSQDRANWCALNTAGVVTRDETWRTTLVRDDRIQAAM